MSRGFEFDNKFNTDNSFTSVRFGYDRPILETELNEMQEIQNYNRRSLMQKICKSGVIDLVDKDFKNDRIVYNPNMERNKIAIAPMRINVNGYEIHVCGDYQIDDIKNYLDIDLGDAPSGTINTKYRDDLVFLQVWFEEIDSSSPIYKYGNTDCSTIENTLIDSRVGEETSHRMGLKWRINVAKDIDFDSWEYGFGYNSNSTGNYSPVYTTITKNINIVDRADVAFANATHTIFQGCSFFGDNNLWIAGRPYSLNHTIKIQPYIEKDGTISTISLNQIGIKTSNTETTTKYYDLSSMDFFGTWDTKTDSSGNTIKTTKSLNSYVTLNFTGDNIKLFAGNIAKQGKYIITIDDSSTYTVDLSVGNIVSENNNVVILSVDTLNSYSSSANTKDSNFVFGIPLFKVSRRNQQVYSLLNPNGSSSYDDSETNLRPDGKCYDMIYESDILDLRKNVIINNDDLNYYFNNTLNKLFTGSLTTKSEQKMRRLQFGIEPLTGQEPNLAFLDSFNKGGAPILGNTPVIAKRSTSTVVNYCPSVTEWGLKVDGNIMLAYNISSINPDEGTIDFFITSVWNGFDNINQNILGLYNTAFNYPFLTIDKVGNTLAVKRYADSTNNPYISSINVNINEMLTKKVYHIRTCWSVSNNTFELYINGNLVGNALDKTIPSGAAMNITQLKIGKVESTAPNNMGFVIDELAIYKTYKGNSEWTLPQDYIKGDALILPSMNGIFRNYRDNTYTQKDMVNQIKTTSGVNTFTITAPYNTVFTSTAPTVYCLTKTATSSGALNVGDVVTGTWTGLNTSTLTFTKDTSIPTFTKFTGETLAVVFEVTLYSNNSVNEVPLEVLKSQVYHLDDKTTEEVSFNDENNLAVQNDAREVKTLITKTINSDSTIEYTGRRYLYDIWDTAYDFSTYRDSNNRDFAFVRLLDYNMAGNGTNLYTFESNLYGYDVLYVRNAYFIHTTTERVKQITPLNVLDIYKTTSGGKTYFNVTISQAVMSGDYIKFELALGGSTFDYNQNSKTFVGDTCAAQYLEFTSDGLSFEYLIPCNNLITSGLCTNGILKSVGTQYKHNFNSSGLEIIDPTYKGEYICFVNDKLHTYTYIDGINKPYLKIHISNIDSATNTEQKIPSGQKIKIPVFITQQHTKNDILSVWYNYIPYQGILDNTPVQLKRITDWKYFITTLSSGNTDDTYNKAHSVNNLINYLPGGAGNSPLITGQNIDLKINDYSNSVINNNYYVDKQLIFVNQTYIGTPNDDIGTYLFDLDTDYTLNKTYGNIQDDTININNKNFKVFLPVSNGSINRYCGMACVVSNQFGDLYLFVIGDTNDNLSTVNNFISPKFGDLFTIPYRPGFINRK
jgi:hypothetical protein